MDSLPDDYVIENTVNCDAGRLEALTPSEILGVREEKENLLCTVEESKSYIVDCLQFL